jgi:photosystem II stability/assembly factor-like uncharacterized protein
MNTRATTAFLALMLALSWNPAQAHDASAWGGLFRSRDHGASWLFANTGSFVGGAIALAISPTDSNHLLLATDTGLLRSRNGGRDWTLEAPSVVVGSVTAVAFDVDGRRALASTASAMFASGDGASWHKLRTPKGATPARAIFAGSSPGHVYVAGSRRLIHSEDWGASWAAVPARGLPDEPVTVVSISAAAPESVYVVAGGMVYAKGHDAREWMRRSEGLPSTVVDTLLVDQGHPGSIWAVAASQVFQSDDAGVHWRPVGRPLSESATIVRAIAVTERSIILTTTRGLYRSIDQGGSWELVSENLPAHLEAGPLVSDPADPATLYAGFSLRPYSEVWRPAVDPGPLRQSSNVTGLAGAAVVVGLVGLAVGVTLPRLGRRRQW